MNIETRNGEVHRVISKALLYYHSACLDVYPENLFSFGDANITDRPVNCAVCLRLERLTEMKAEAMRAKAIV